MVLLQSQREVYTFCILLGSFVGVSLGGTFPKSFQPGSLCSTGRLSFTLLANRLLGGGQSHYSTDQKSRRRAIITVLTWSLVGAAKRVRGLKNKRVKGPPIKGFITTCVTACEQAAQDHRSDSTIQGVH